MRCRAALCCEKAKEKKKNSISGVPAARYEQSIGGGRWAGVAHARAIALYGGAI